MLESKIEEHLKARVKQYGGEIRKVKWPGRRGAPDRLVMLPAMAARMREDQTGFPIYMPEQPNRVALVELKKPGQKPEAHQEREHKRLRAYFEVVVLDSTEAIDQWLPPL